MREPDEHIGKQIGCLGGSPGHGSARTDIEFVAKNKDLNSESGSKAESKVIERISSVNNQQTKRHQTCMNFPLENLRL